MSQIANRSPPVILAIMALLRHSPTVFAALWFGSQLACSQGDTGATFGAFSGPGTPANSTTMSTGTPSTSSSSGSEGAVPEPMATTQPPDPSGNPDPSTTTAATNTTGDRSVATTTGTDTGGQGSTNDPSEGATGGDVPPLWTCQASWYGDAECDCGCGAEDIDCGALATCDYCWCYDEGGCGLLGCSTWCTPNNPTCEGAVPPTWTCNQAYFSDTDCDCGCGVPDPTCVDATLDACDFCGLPGSCSFDDCPGSIDPVNNATCF